MRGLERFFSALVTAFLLASIAHGADLASLQLKRDALARDLANYRELVPPGTILVPNREADDYVALSPRQFGQLLPQLMAELGFERRAVIEFLAATIKLHQTITEDIKTRVIPGIERDIREIDAQIADLKPPSSTGLAQSSGTQINRNIYSSDYGKPIDSRSHEPGSQLSPSGQAGGIVARILRQHQCKYRSGGDPGRRSNHICKIEYTIENTTDKDIKFSSGQTETEHEWEKDKMKRQVVGYKYSLKPGQVMHLNSACIIPHGAQTGSWQAWGTGFHPADTSGRTLSWSLQTLCP